MTAYDAATPNLAAELAAKPQFLCAYTDGNFAYGAARVAQIRAAGVGVLANHERATNQLLAGASGGQQAATDAVAAVLAWGMPADGICAIHYSVDLSVDPSQYSAVGQAFDAIKAVHGGRFKVGFYGQGGLGDWLTATGRLDVKYWLSASSNFPGYNRASPHVGMYQLIGTDVPGTDQNTVVDASGLGVWWPTNHVPAALSLGEDMIELLHITDSAAVGQVWAMTATDMWYLSPTSLAQWQTSKLVVATTPRDITYGQFLVYQADITANTTARNSALAAAIVALADGVAAVPAATVAKIPAATLDTNAVTVAAQAGAANALSSLTLVSKGA